MRRKPRLSPRAAIAVWFTAAAAAHAGVPWLLSRRGRRLGWRGRGPSAANRTGVIGVVVGTSALAWCYVSHRASAPSESVEISLVPEYLAVSGPYRRSRNPMYVAELAIWLGWAVFYGSPSVMAGTGALVVGMNVAVRREERTLQRQFGQSYLDYAASVPRWL